MDASVTKKPRTILEMLSDVGAILSEDAKLALTAKKKPRQTIATSRTSEKVLKPASFAQIKADIASLRVQSPKRMPQATASNQKRWNHSVKLDNKTVSHTAGGQMKHNSVRKVLNFQPPKARPPPKERVNPIPIQRTTMMPVGTSKFTKPDLKIKKPLLQANNNVRISGVCKIPETPLTTSNNDKSQKIINHRKTIANKENQSCDRKKLMATPKSAKNKRLIRMIPDTPMSNESWKSSCDSSFLQNEKEIEIHEARANALLDEPTLERIAEITPPVSTPFHEYRNVKEYFNNSSDVMDNTECQDNTIMCFDDSSKEKVKREESVIVSLCDMLNKATVSTEKLSTELEDLLEFEKQTINNIRILNNVKELQVKSLMYVQKLIQDKRNANIEYEKDKTVVEAKETKAQTPERSCNVGKPCSVIKIAKSPSYKIPKKNTCLRKKVFYKSMPNVSDVLTPQKEMSDKALTVYMKLKENMNFLNTPVVKQRETQRVPNTPAITSHNLQKQLDKLYG